MAKRRRSRRASKAESGKTNWVLILGIVGVAIIGLGALLFITQNSPADEPVVLSAYCAENPDRCVSMGNADAAVTLVEVSDFGCTHCRDFHLNTAETLKTEFVDTDQMHWLFLPFALRPETQPAAAAAMCAAEQDKYFEFAEAMFVPELGSTLSREGYTAAAETTGLDMDAFNACVDDGRFNNIVSMNSAAASQAGVEGTPTFFLNDQIIRGNLPLADFQRQITLLLGA